MQKRKTDLSVFFFKVFSLYPIIVVIWDKIPCMGGIMLNKKEELISKLKEALECLKKRDKNRADVLLAEVRDELTGLDDSREIEGEWNLLMSICYFLKPDLALPYLKQARSMIKGHSRVVPFGVVVYEKIYGPLFLFLQVPGTADEVGEKLVQMMDLYDELIGGMSRCDHLYYAQLYFYRGKFDKVESYLLKAEGSAKKCKNLMDLICVAEYRCRLAIHLNDPRMWTRGVSFISGLQNHENRTIREVATCMKCKIYMSVGMMSGIPKWILDGQFGAISDEGTYRLVEDRVTHMAFPIVWLTYTEYLLSSGDFYRVLNSADIATHLYGLNRMMLYDCYLHLYRASAWVAIGDEERASKYLKTVIDIVKPDGLWCFGADFFPNLRGVLFPALKALGDRASVNYLKFTEEYTMKVNMVRDRIAHSVFKEPLTEKEQAVGRLAALGYKNDCIAEELYISPNTVKFHLANVYKKLGIKNRVGLKEAMERTLARDFAYWIEDANSDK